jgi:hypothetical protein
LNILIIEPNRARVDNLISQIGVDFKRVVTRHPEAPVWMVLSIIGGVTAGPVAVTAVLLALAALDAAAPEVGIPLTAELAAAVEAATAVIAQALKAEAVKLAVAAAAAIMVLVQSTPSQAGQAPTTATGLVELIPKSSLEGAPATLDTGVEVKSSARPGTRLFYLGTFRFT